MYHNFKNDSYMKLKKYYRDASVRSYRKINYFNQRNQFKRLSHANYYNNVQKHYNLIWMEIRKHNSNKKYIWFDDIRNIMKFK